MKTLKNISVLFAFLLLSSGVFAQECTLKITDENNTDGAYYSGWVELWDLTGTPDQLSHENFTSEYFSISGATALIYLTYQVAPDIERLKFYAVAQNTSTSKYGDGWSASYFDSYDYNNNKPPVTVNIQ